MNNQATLEKLNRMKLYGMERSFTTTMQSNINNSFTADELIAHLVDAEWDERYNRKLTRLVKGARFRYQAAVEQIDFLSCRNLDKNTVLRLSEKAWIEKKQNIIISGPTGAGKSFLASAIGHQACINAFKVLYFNTTKLFPMLKLVKADGSYQKELKKLEKTDVLILDDFGLTQLDTQNRLSLLEILEDRHGKKSTVISSQIPVSKWHDIIGDPTIADAVCDRIIHSSIRIELKGGSMRKKQKG